MFQDVTHQDTVVKVLKNKAFNILVKKICVISEGTWCWLLIILSGKYLMAMNKVLSVFGILFCGIFFALLNMSSGT